MPKRSPSYSSLLLKCDHKSFPICVLYFWHESQHPEKVHRKTKGHCICVLKEREKKNSKSWLLISNAVWERSSSKGGNVKINKGKHHYTGVRSPARGALTDTPLTHIQIPTERDISCIFGRKWHYYCQQEEEKFSPCLAPAQSMRDCRNSANTKNQPIQKITILWTPSFLQLTFYL